MTAQPLPGGTLVGNHVRLEPLTDAHLPGLFEAIARPEVFAGGWGGGPAALTPERASDAAAFGDWFTAYVPMTTGVTYAVVQQEGDGVARVIGTSSLGHVDLACESLHIGWTAYAPHTWGTAVNPECKLLLLQHAFERGFGRVQIQADARNERSRAAIARLGATFEGVLRRTNQRADGTWRDTAVSSILAAEWPRVRAGLRERLAAAPASPKPAAG